MLKLAPNTCFCIESEGRVVATSALIPFGRELASLGMVLTHPDYRRRGFARQLVQHAIEQAGQLGIPTVKLDATESGRPLYEALGFRAEQPVERWVREGSHQDPAIVSNGSLPLDLDRQACGYDRADLLSLLSAASYCIAGANGYLMCRPGALNTYLGPCVARNHSTAEGLIGQYIEQQPGAGYFWDLLPLGNKNAAHLAQSLGFQSSRRLTRMALGPHLRGREECIYAIAGFEFG